MTCEVVVMNRIGVALAADSAVDASVGESSKIRESGLKLFMLSKYRPVAVMVYNSSLLLGVPWETIIKLFRQELGSQQLDTVSEYAEALIGYVERNTARFFPEDVQDRHFIRILEVEFARIKKEVSEEWEYLQGGTEAEAKEAIEKVIEGALTKWQHKENDESPHFDDRLAGELLSRNSAGVHRVVGEVFAGKPFGSTGVRHLHEIAKLVVTKNHFVFEEMSGLVIAGFGEAEHFPAVEHVTIGGVYGDRVKSRREAAEQVSEKSASSIMAFGDNEAVNSFIVGVRPKLLTWLIDAQAYIRELPIKALDAIPGLNAEQRATAEAIVRAASERKAAEFGEWIFNECAGRSAETKYAVETLALRELAHVASTLVGLGSFQKQMSQERETIGGPVDVAVISKGDGFIWINRKYYFDKRLNDHFFRNYYEDGAAQGEIPADGDNGEVHDGE